MLHVTTVDNRHSYFDEYQVGEVLLNIHACIVMYSCSSSNAVLVFDLEIM